MDEADETAVITLLELLAEDVESISPNRSNQTTKYGNNPSDPDDQ